MRKMLTTLIMTAVFTGAYADSGLESLLFKLARNYYAGMEKIYQKVECNRLSAEDMDLILEPVKSEAALISDRVIEKMKKSDNSEYNELVKLYNKHVKAAPELREPFNLVADDVVEYQKSLGLMRQEYFPGYGYAEDGPYGYKYRKTNELSLEVISVYWKKVDETIENGKTKKLVLEVELAANFDPGAVLKAVGIPFEIKVEGKTKMVCEYEVTAKKTTTTSCNKKMQTVKIWFQLQRAKKVWPFWGKWKDCGKTYDMVEEESSLPVAEIAIQGAMFSLKITR
ncbi:MAG: hypothetical protein PHW04_18410 [Candidatus Wallbacteria bacterium]|nr:hypothetical protein [Candidatus Wallbacteria bacterium]